MAKPNIFVKISYKILRIIMSFKDLKYSFWLCLFVCNVVSDWFHTFSYSRCF